MMAGQIGDLELQMQLMVDLRMRARVMGLEASMAVGDSGCGKRG